MEKASKNSIKGIIRILNSRNFEVFTKPYKLNIVGVRKNTSVPNKFDDTIYVFWKNDKGFWEGKSYPATTDPGTYYLKKPMNNFGTAILKEGQYKNAYKLGMHRGQYKALVQQSPVTVIRDYDRDATLDFKEKRQTTGNYGINIHRSSSKGTSIDVDNWSAGCQVFANGKDFDDFINLAEKHKSLYGNNFTYTLIDERAYNRGVKRRFVYLIVAVSVLTTSFFAYKYIAKKGLLK